MSTQDDISLHSGSSLERLFARARDTEPRLVDDNFTKLVINHLPDTQEAAVRQRNFLPDFVGLLLGFLALSLVVEPAQLMSKLAGLLPQSITISTGSLLLTATAFSLLSLFAWWSLERDG